MRDSAYFFLGALVMAAWVILVDVYKDAEDPYREWECSTVRDDISSFRECLAIGCACRVDGPKAFGLYREQVNYFKERC